MCTSPFGGWRSEQTISPRYIYIKCVMQEEVRLLLIRISSLWALDVINIVDGRRLGNIIDIDIDMETGQINELILSGPGHLFSWFGRRDDISIPWSQIVKIGVDVILVEVASLAREYGRQ